LNINCFTKTLVRMQINTRDMKIKILIVIELIFIATYINAQKDFRTGYVILTKSDSLFGEIDYRKDLLMGQVCNFKNIDTEGKPANEKQFLPNEIIGYRFDNGKFFISKEINGKKLFLEFLIKGKINIYYNRDENGDHYYLEKDSSGIIEIPYENYIRYENNVPYYYNSNKHIGLLNLFMHDAPELQSKILQLGKPEHRNLIKLAKDYHNAICKDSLCIIYEKKVPFAKISFELIVGLNSINTKMYEAFKNEKYNKQYINKPNVKYGVITHLWLPRTSENFYFRSGIEFFIIEANWTSDSLLYIDNDLNYHYTTIIGEKTMVPTYKIPLQIEYVYPKGVFRPMVAYGVNLHSPFAFDLSLICGFNIKLHKSVFLNFSYDYEYFGPIIPKRTMAHSLNFGFKINL
jgi:hypothetical protein